MTRGRKRLAKAVAVLATGGVVVERAVRKAAADPRVRKKAAEVGEVVRTKVKAAGRAAGKRAGALAQDAGAMVGKKLKGPRKAAGERIKRLGEKVSG